MLSISSPIKFPLLRINVNWDSIGNYMIVNYCNQSSEQYANGNGGILNEGFVLRLVN